MKMKRGITTLLSVAVLSTSLVACSGTAEKTVAKEEKVKLVYGETRELSGSLRCFFCS